jgi:hypothetical protein
MVIWLRSIETWLARGKAMRMKWCMLVLLAAALTGCGAPADPQASEAVGASAEALDAPFEGAFDYAPIGRTVLARTPLVLHAPVLEMQTATSLASDAVLVITLSFAPGEGTAVVDEAARLAAAGRPFRSITLTPTAGAGPTLYFADAWVVHTSASPTAETLTFSTAPLTPTPCKAGDILCVPSPF